MLKSRRPTALRAGSQIATEARKPIASSASTVPTPRCIRSDIATLLSFERSGLAALSRGIVLRQRHQSGEGDEFRRHGAGPQLVLAVGSARRHVDVELAGHRAEPVAPALPSAFEQLGTELHGLGPPGLLCPTVALASSPSSIEKYYARSILFLGHRRLTGLRRGRASEWRRPPSAARCGRPPASTARGCPGRR